MNASAISLAGRVKRLDRLAWVPIPILVLAMLVLWAMNLQGAYFAPRLVFVLQLVFMSFASARRICLANEAGLTQCMSNLLGNAVKFVAPGVVPHVRVWAESVDGRVRLLVRDNAIGMGKDAHRTLFRIFERLGTGYEGTGVGLAIVKKAAERMGGRVGFESEPGQGSTFWVGLAPADDAGGGA